MVIQRFYIREYSKLWHSIMNTITIITNHMNAF
jgi:hypothetical protein